MYIHISKTKIILFFTALIMVFSSYAQNAEAGKEIFKTKCTSCHSIEKDLVGPALRDVDKRRSMEWIISFVQRSQTKVKSGDTIAVALFNKYNQAIMPDQSDLKDEQIKNIVEYIKTESKNLSATTNNPKRPTEQYPHYTPIQWTDYWVWSLFGLMLVVMVWGLQLRIKIANWEKKN